MLTLIVKAVKPDQNSLQVRKTIQNTYRKFYEETVLPFAGTANAPELWLLCGVQRNGSTDLYTSDQLSIKENHTYAAIGSGEGVARALIESTFPFATVAVTKLLMVYALMHVRNRVDGIGGKSMVVTIKDNSSSIMPANMIARTEKAFEDYDNAQAGLLQYVVGHLEDDGMGIVGDEAKVVRDELRMII
jgi:hypothetical protein